MPRKALPKEERVTVAVTVRFLERDYHALRKQAAEEGRSMANLLRTAGLQRLNDNRADTPSTPR
jgi:hypothetical protein